MERLFFRESLDTVHTRGILGSEHNHAVSLTAFSPPSRRDPSWGLNRISRRGRAIMCIGSIGRYEEMLYGHQGRFLIAADATRSPSYALLGQPYPRVDLELDARALAALVLDESKPTTLFEYGAFSDFTKWRPS